MTHPDNHSPKWLSAAHFRALTPWPQLIDAVESAYREGITAPPRQRHALGGQDAAMLLLMPAWGLDGLVGLKMVRAATAPAGGPAVAASYMLMDAATGVPLAMIDGEELTVRRTAAMAAAATRALAARDARALLVIGTGNVARAIPAAISAVRPLSSVMIWGRDAARAADAASAISGDLDCDVRAVADLEQAAGRADIICSAVPTAQPLLAGAWLRSGCHVNLIGGFTPAMREADDALIARATILVDSLDGALREAGDIVDPLARGVIPRSAIIGTFADLASGRIAGRADAHQITLFKSVGNAAEDLAAAALAWSALRAGDTDFSSKSENPSCASPN